MGSFLGRWLEQRKHFNQTKKPPLLTHGIVLNFDDLPFKNTVHVDKSGVPIRKKQYIQPFVIPNLSGFSVVILSVGQTVETHEHESMHEIFYIVTGQASFVIDGVTHIVGPGTVVHLAPHEKHSIEAVQSQDGKDLTLAYFGVTVS